MLVPHRDHHNFSSHGRKQMKKTNTNLRTSFIVSGHEAHPSVRYYQVCIRLMDCSNCLIVVISCMMIGAPKSFELKTIK